MSNRNNLSQLADEIVDFIDRNPSNPGQMNRALSGTTGPNIGWLQQASPAPSGTSGPAASGCPNGSVVVPMEVTAYTNGPESTGKRPGDPGYGITASGAKAGPGTLAAPPSYAFGTRMYVPGYGWGTVQDRGGAIRGNHLDVWFENVEEAKRWGRQRLDVNVCKG